MLAQLPRSLPPRPESTHGIHTFSPLARLNRHRSAWQNLPRASKRRRLVSGATKSQESLGSGMPHPEETFDDDVLPDSLAGALEEASIATAQALKKGQTRCIVEILLPEFWDPDAGPTFAEEGDQLRFWKLTRRFVEGIIQHSNLQNIKAVYPDMGTAAMLKHQWQDCSFRLASLGDRRPVSIEDDVVIVAAPDPQGAEPCMKIASELENVRSLVIFNPRFTTVDIGVGLNVRRLRREFLSTFDTTYSLRPIGEVGTVFRQYPGLWKVFLSDPARPGRFKLAAERPSRPSGEMIEMIMEEEYGRPADKGREQRGPNLLSSVGSAFASLQRFGRSLSQ